MEKENCLGYVWFIENLRKNEGKKIEREKKKDLKLIIFFFFFYDFSKLFHLF